MIKDLNDGKISIAEKQGEDWKINVKYTREDDEVQIAEDEPGNKDDQQRTATSTPPTAKTAEYAVRAVGAITSVQTANDLALKS